MNAESGATFSPCRRYRYALWRTWDASKPTVVFCGLNPSTADETEDDPTIRRELGYARDWGFGRFVKVNAYAYRSTDPKQLWKAADPCGEDNLGHILQHARAARLFVAAWGNNIRPAQENAILTAMVVADVKVHAIGITKAGHPIHPLYQLKTAKPFQWRAA